MQFTKRVALLGVAELAAAHPIGDVIEMLKGLASKAEAEGKEEALAFEKFDYWCKNSIKEVSHAIQDETETIASLEDKIAAGEEQKKQHEANIASLEGELAELDQAQVKAAADRAKGQALYNQTSSDLTDTLTATTAALGALEQSAKGSAFVQVLERPEVRQTLLLAQAAAPEESEQGRHLAALLQQRPEFEAEGDRAAHVQQYESKTGDVIETIKGLKLQFEDELLAANKGETNAINAYNLAKQERDNVVTTSQASLAETQTALSDVEADLTTLGSELTSAKNDKVADEATFDETDKACQVKKQEWEQRSAVRTGEIAAIDAAVKILAEASNVRTEAPGNPDAPASPAFFLQMRAVSQTDREVDPRVRALNLLRSTALKTHSKNLARLAQEFSMHLDDPFGAVTNSIEKMIFHLMDEQRQEDEHKAWCDQELSHNNASKVDKEDKIAGLTKKIESTDAMIVKLSSEVETAQGQIAEIVAFMKEATEIREIGRKENDLALADAQQAQKAIADATGVITSFYKESGMVKKEAWESFIQQHQPTQLSGKPDTWGSSYSGVAGPEDQPGGIITVLKKVASDFAMMEADTRAQEATDQAQFEEDIKENKIAKAEREQGVHTKTAEKDRQIEINSELNKERKHESDELEQVNIYLKDLIPACVAGDSTYEERKAAREQETQGLRDAQNILAEAFREKDPVAAPAPASAGAFLGIHRHA